MTYARWECPPPWWPAEAGAWPWGYRGYITAGRAADGAAVFIAQTRRFIAALDAELREAAPLPNPVPAPADG